MHSIPQIVSEFGKPSSLTLPSLTFGACICLCGSTTALATDPEHVHSCPKLRGAAPTQRHDHLRNALTDILRTDCEFITEQEPLDHMRTPEMSEEAERRLQESIRLDKEGELPRGYNVHGDLLAMKHDTKLYLDVTVVRPTCPSLCVLQSVQTKPLAATLDRAKRKHNLYDPLCAMNGYEMVAAVFESTGGVGSEMVRLLKRLAPHCRSMTANEFLTHALTRLGICLARGNAALALTGMQRLAKGRYEQRLKQTHAFAAGQSERALRYVLFSQKSNAHTHLMHVTHSWTQADSAARAHCQLEPEPRHLNDTRTATAPVVAVTAAPVTNISPARSSLRISRRLSFSSSSSLSLCLSSQRTVTLSGSLPYAG
jgi:hypothetical protein